MNSCVFPVQEAHHKRRLSQNSRKAAARGTPQPSGQRPSTIPDAPNCSWDDLRRSGTGTWGGRVGRVTGPPTHPPTQAPEDLKKHTHTHHHHHHRHRRPPRHRMRGGMRSYLRRRVEGILKEDPPQLKCPTPGSRDDSGKLGAQRGFLPMIWRRNETNEVQSTDTGAMLSNDAVDGITDPQRSSSGPVCRSGRSDEVCGHLIPSKDSRKRFSSVSCRAAQKERLLNTSNRNWVPEEREGESLGAVRDLLEAFSRDPKPSDKNP